jgi:hypothetical protein
MGDHALKHETPTIKLNPIKCTSLAIIYTCVLVRSFSAFQAHGTIGRRPGVLPIGGLVGNPQRPSKHPEFPILSNRPRRVGRCCHFDPPRTQEAPRLAIRPPDNVGNPGEGLHEGCLVHSFPAHVLQEQTSDTAGVRRSDGRLLVGLQQPLRRHLGLVFRDLPLVPLPQVALGEYPLFDAQVAPNVPAKLLPSLLVGEETILANQGGDTTGGTPSLATC